MPLIEGKSNAARAANIKTEIAVGKDPEQAAAIAYSVQRKAQAERRRANDSAPLRGALDCLAGMAADCMARRR